MEEEQGEEEEEGRRGRGGVRERRRRKRRRAGGEGGEEEEGKECGIVGHEGVGVGAGVMCLDCGHLRQNVAPSGRPFVPALRDLRDSSVSVMADTVSSLSAVISTSFYWYLSISLIKAQIF